MINEISYKATARNSSAKITFVALLVLSALNFIAYALMSANGVQKSGLVGLLVLALITSSVFVYTRYVGVYYMYDITVDSYGTYVFVVRQITGKRESTLCRVDLAGIHKITREDKDARAKHKTPYGYRKYNYVPTLFPSETYRLLSIGRYERAEIIIEADEDFILTLESGAKAARELRSEDDDF